MKNEHQKDARGRGDWQGMNWIRQEKRLAIYLRDGLACVWCGSSAEGGSQLSLDHLRPHSRGGSNEASNLVTSCTRCNSARGNRPAALFAQHVATYLNHGIDARNIVRHVRNCAARSLAAHTIEAKKMIARRGSASRALEKIYEKNN
jgi:hypothetical protein